MNEETAAETTAHLVEIRRRRRAPWVVMASVGLVAVVVLALIAGSTTTGLSQRLAEVCTAAGPNVPREASNDCRQAQRGEIPVDAGGLPGLDGRDTDEPVTVVPTPGAPVTIYPPDPTTVTLPPVTLPPVALPAPGALTPVPTVTVRPVPGPPLTVTRAAVPAAPETVTVTAEPPAPATVTETITESVEVVVEPPPTTVTETVVETVTVTAEPGPPPSEAPPTSDPESPVTTSGAPSPAPSAPTEEPAPAPPPSPAAATVVDGQDAGVLEHLLGFALGM